MKKYFDCKVPTGFFSIYASRTIARIALSMMGVFMPIFLYQLFGGSIRTVMLYYLIDILVYIVFLPLGARFALNKVGIKQSMIIASAWMILYYLVFYFTSQWFFSDSGTTLGLDTAKLTVLFFGLSIFFLNVKRLLYWVPYHTDTAKFTDEKNRVRELSLFEATMMFMQAVMPLAAGFLLLSFNYNILFVISIFVYFASAIPLIALPPTKETFSWSYWQTFKELFSKKRRRTALAYAGDGAENIVNSVVWPIFIFEILQGNYFQVGVISSLIVAASILLQFMVGRLGDHGKRDKMLRIGIVLYSIGWVIKVFIETAFQIFVVSTYHNLTRIFTRAPFDAIYYNKASHEGHFVDEYTVVREMALNIGSAAAYLAVFIVAPFVGIQWTFILAAIASLFMNFLVKDDEESCLALAQK